METNCCCPRGDKHEIIHFFHSPQLTKMVMLGIVISYLSSETAGSDHEMEQNCRNRLQSCRVFE